MALVGNILQESRVEVKKSEDYGSNPERWYSSE